MGMGGGGKQREGEGNEYAKTRVQWSHYYWISWSLGLLASEMVGEILALGKGNAGRMGLWGRTEVDNEKLNKSTRSQDMTRSYVKYKKVTLWEGTTETIRKGIKKMVKRGKRG